GARGLRTLAVRLRQHGESALQIAQWLAGQPDVAQVLHPALPDCPGHAHFVRDFNGASGLFGFVLNGSDEAARAALI
ncbi:PLP-dependent transferase, partial [Acinetobacter baumannii]